MSSKDLIPEFIKKRTEIAGGATGAALGFIAAGPTGAGASGAIVTLTGG